MNRIRLSGQYSCFLSLSVINLAFVAQLIGQTFTVDGTVSVATTTVSKAMITFIDLNDTTQKFSALTDESGYYQMDLVAAVACKKFTPPIKFELAQNYPNPFASRTSIPYKLNQTSEVKMTIYDVLGRVVKQYAMPDQSAGSHDVIWHGLDDYGKSMAAGIYFYRIQVAGESQIRKMILYGGSGNDIRFTGPVSFPKHSRDAAALILGGTYRVIIDTTGETYPLIIPETLDDQVIEGTSTLNFTVSTLYPIANSDIDLDDTKQVIRGFGAANILPWRPDMTADEIQKAFGTGDGEIGFSILRLRLPNNPSEFGLNVRTAKAAHGMGVAIMASPWSPPASMKDNNNTVGGRLKDDSYDDFAAYLKSFADYMAGNGVPIHSISVQNEPDVSVSYESCDYTAEEMLKFMKENAPAVGVPVCAPESFHFAKSMSDPILNDSVATAHTAYISGHIYGGGLESYPLAAEKGKEIWITEHLVLDTEWNAVLGTGKEIHDCMVAGMSAYIWWYIVRFYGPIIDDDYSRPPGTQKGDVSQRGFVMSQFARFIRPGYYRVQSTTLPQRNIYVSAYKESESVISIVALNTGNSPIYQTFTILNGNVDSVLPYTTTNLKNCTAGSTVTLENNSFTVLLEPSSITTFVAR